LVDEGDLPDDEQNYEDFKHFNIKDIDFKFYKVGPPKWIRMGVTKQKV
jgi:hypothetical protein